MLKCVERIIKLAESVGASVDQNSLGGGTIIIDAPLGYSWDANGASSIVTVAESMGQGWWSQACKDAEEDMRYGLSKCNEDESARIQFERDEEWSAPDGSPERLEVK